MQDKFQLYQRKAIWVEMRPYVSGESLLGIKCGCVNPEVDMGFIARDPNGPEGSNHTWYVPKANVEENYTLHIQGTIEDKMEQPTTVTKTLANTDANGATKNVKDIQFWGDGDTFKLISKASSDREGWMKSTKAMDVGNGVVVQVTTQQRNPDGGYSLAEAVTFVPNVKIEETYKDTNNESDVEEVLSRRIVPLS